MYWTGSAVDLLPSMIREDSSTRVVDKAAGTRAFEEAMTWALAASAEGGSERAPRSR